MSTSQRKYYRSCVGLVLWILLMVTSAVAFADTVQTSWVGNTFGGTPTGGNKYTGKWVQNGINGMYVASDGTCYTASWWDEGGREKGVYKDGDVLGQTWDPGACVAHRAIIGDGTYIYIGELPSDGSGASIRRYHATLNGNVLWQATGWAGASGDGSYLRLTTTNTMASVPTAIAVNATNNELYVADPTVQRIRVFNRNSGSSTELASWAYPTGAGNCRSIVVEDPSGSSSALWINYDGSNIGRYSNRGTAHTQTITGFTDATAMCRDNAGRLMICDNGPAQNIKIYGNLSGTPTLSGTLGALGGVFSGTRGEHGPSKFYDLCGVGVDSSDNVYIAMGKYYFDQVDAFYTGAEIRKLTSSGTQDWQLLGCHFVDCADVDPTTDGLDIYGAQEHYTMDYSQPAGHQWTWKAYTLDRFTYPNDPRLTTALQSPIIRDINGHRFMFLTDMSGYLPYIYRFDGEIAVPCGKFTADSPWAAGTRSFYYWRDANGDGTLSSSETTTLQSTVSGVGGWNFAWNIDANGNFWFIPYYGGAPGNTAQIYEAQLQGFDANGAPLYDQAHTVQYTMTNMPFNDVARMEYLPATDTMYLTSSGSSGVFIGDAIKRYDGWKAGNRTPTYTITLPWTGDTNSVDDILPKSFDVAGDYIFVTELRHHGLIRVYNANTGSFVRTMIEDPNIEANGGDGDLDYAIRAFRRSNGDYIILREEDAHGKVSMFIWTPDQVATPTFSPTPGAYTAAQTVTLSCVTSGATIRYTTDGTDPTATSTAYSTALTVSATTTLKAKAFKTGMTDSAVATGTYTISGGTVATPTFSPTPGTYTSAQSVAISCSTSGATIRYTTDGSDPTATSTAYSTALTVSATTTLKAKAFKTGMTDSAIATGSYTIAGLVNGGMYKVIPKNAESAGKVLDVTGGSSTDGTNVQINADTGGTNQQFMLVSQGSGWWRLMPQCATSSAVDVAGMNSSDGTNVDISTWNATYGQQFRFTDLSNGYYRITPRCATSSAVDVSAAGTADGTNVLIWTYGDNKDNQMWKLIRVD